MIMFFHAVAVYVNTVRITWKLLTDAQERQRNSAFTAMNVCIMTANQVMEIWNVGNAGIFL